MSDLIKRDEAVQMLDEYIKPFIGLIGDMGSSINGAREIIKSIPAAEPKVGEWIEKSMMWCDDPAFKCSICGEGIELIEGTPKSHGMNYCPNCGAKMERRADEKDNM